MSLLEQVVSRLEATVTDLTTRNNELHKIILDQIAKINKLEADNRTMTVELDKYESNSHIAGVA